MSTTTATLSDGRRVDVPRAAVADWAIAAADGDTTLSLADWYTQEGEARVDEIYGDRAPEHTDEWPKCQHIYDEPTRVRVTNASQVGAYDPTRPHVSSVVCGRRACILDALAWVERQTGEQGMWIGDDLIARADLPEVPVAL